MMSEIPHDALLREENALLRREIEVLRQQIDTLQQDNLLLRLKLDAMARRLFGKSSEKLDPAQLQMVFKALQDEIKKAAASDPSANGSGGSSLGSNGTSAAQQEAFA